jgi:hypothetical protein
MFFSWFSVFFSATFGRGEIFCTASLKSDALQSSDLDVAAETVKVGIAETEEVVAVEVLPGTNVVEL